MLVKADLGTRCEYPGFMKLKASTTPQVSKVPANKPAAQAPAETATKQAGWGPRPAAVTTRSVGWAPADKADKLAGTFKGNGAGIASVELRGDSSFSLKTTDGQTVTGEFGVGSGGAAFGDTFALKTASGLRLFGVNEVERDRAGKILSVQLGEFVDGSPTNIAPVDLKRVP